jgi:hypothetical protein
MSKRNEDQRDFIGSGNFLGKQRRNFNVSNKAWNLMHELALELGVSHSAIIELAVRHFYQSIKGDPGPIKYTPERRTK